jgi:hypothetical protein
MLETGTGDPRRTEEITDKTVTPQNPLEGFWLHVLKDDVKHEKMHATNSTNRVGFRFRGQIVAFAPV